jgi:uncharacterized protein YceH (UPF0502 family)
LLLIIDYLILKQKNLCYVLFKDKVESLEDRKESENSNNAGPEVDAKISKLENVVSKLEERLEDLKNFTVKVEPVDPFYA